TRKKERSFSLGSRIARLCFSQTDHLLAAATDDGRITIFQVPLWKELCQFQAHSRITGISFIGTRSYLLSSGSDAEHGGGSSIRIFDSRSRKQIYYQRFGWKNDPRDIAINQAGDTLYILFLFGELSAWRIAIE